MNYSSPIWSSSPTDDYDENLESAQLRKVHHILDKARIGPGHHILDIGGGWGSLSIEAARRVPGCRVTATTLSREQKALFDRRVREAGLQDRVECIVCDYRSTPRPGAGGVGYYDRVVSVEMVEHVGREHLRDYFAAIERVLRPDGGGVAVVQGITITNGFYKLHANVDNFIGRYIFPGGFLPSVALLLASVDAGSAGKLEIDSVESIGPHYAKALRLWREKFEANWPAIRSSLEKNAGQQNKPMTEAEMEAYRRRWVVGP